MHDRQVIKFWKTEVWVWDYGQDLDMGKQPLLGKERKSIYIAPFCTKVHTKRSGMDHTVLPANNTMPAFPSCQAAICII